MNYCYKIIPKGTYSILRKCAGCGKKMPFQNMRNFRVNANGNRIDVWLVYQCEKCRHTYNLPVYERVRPEQIEKELYQKFLANDRELALQIGNDKDILSRNQAELMSSGEQYELVPWEQKVPQQYIQIENPYEIKVRPDKLLAQVLSLSRKKIKEMFERGSLCKEQGSGTTLLFHLEESDV